MNWQRVLDELDSAAVVFDAERELVIAANARAIRGHSADAGTAIASLDLHHFVCVPVVDESRPLMMAIERGETPLDDLESLVHDHELLERLLDTTQVLVVASKPDGTVVRFNRACERATGFRAEEIIGRKFSETLIPAEEVEPLSVEFERFKRSGPGPHVYENHLRTRSGGMRLFAWSNGVLYDREGNVDLVVGTGIDVTELRLLQRETVLNERMASLGRLASRITHEFNNLLLVVGSSEHTLRRRGDVPDRVADALDRLRRAIRRGRTLTGDVLRYSRPAPLTVETVPLEALLNEVTADFADVGRTGVALRLDDDALAVVGDHDRLYDALLNLLLNARDALENGGGITIEAERCRDASLAFGVISEPQSRVHVRVKDEGRGIPRELLGRVFEPLFTTKASGTGLGLPVVHDIVTRHGGQIFIESEPGSGTTVHLFLPAAVSSSQS